MVKVRPGHVRSEKGNPFKFRLKMYNKAPLHLLQTEDLHKSVSMGLKPLFFCSDTFYRRLLECRDTCMSRVELSHYMGSVKEERDVLGDMFLEEEALELH